MSNTPRMLTVVELQEMCGFRLWKFQAAFLGGSRATVNPPPTDTDCDIFVHCTDLQSAVTYLGGGGWEVGADYVDEDDTFCTFRKDEYNLLVFEDAYEFGAVWGATCVAKQQNLQRKEERYKLFETAREPWRTPCT